MDSPPPLPTAWPNFDLGEPAEREVQILEGALDNVKVFRGISMIVVILGLLVVFFHTSPKVERFVKEGRIVQAKVDERYIQSDDGSKTYHIGYTYRFEGYAYHGRLSVSPARYKTMQKGDALTVTVLPSSGRDHRIGTVGERDVQRARQDGSLIVLAIALPFALLALTLRAQIRREEKILTTWFALPAQVVGLQKKTSDEGQYVVMSYRVPLPNGKVVTKTMVLSDPVAKRVHAGDFFPVLAPPGELYIQERLLTLSSLSAVRLISKDPEEGYLRLTA
jgi:hypothetical protein